MDILELSSMFESHKNKLNARARIFRKDLQEEYNFVTEKEHSMEHSRRNEKCVECSGL